MERTITVVEEEPRGVTILVKDIPAGQIFKCSLAGGLLVKNNFFIEGTVISCLDNPARTWAQLTKVEEYIPAKKVDIVVLF